jgi:hypothetical protein
LPDQLGLKAYTEEIVSFIESVGPTIRSLCDEQGITSFVEFTVEDGGMVKIEWGAETIHSGLLSTVFFDHAATLAEEVMKKYSTISGRQRK